MNSDKIILHRGAFDVVTGDGETKPLCDFCGGMPLTNYGGGQGKIFYECDGCGFKGISEQGVLREIEGDFFDAKYKDKKVAPTS